MATDTEVGDLLALAMASYPTFKKPATDDMLIMIAAYTRILGHLPAEILAAAFDLAVSRSPEFLPAAPKVLEAAGMLAVRGAGSSDLAAFEQWGEVERHIRDFSPDFPVNDAEHYPRNYAAARFADPTTDAVVEMLGGLRALYDSDNPTADRARFLEAYRTQVRRAAEQFAALPGVTTLTLRLEGRHERDNGDAAAAEGRRPARGGGQTLADVAAAARGRLSPPAGG